MQITIRAFWDTQEINFGRKTSKEAYLKMVAASKRTTKAAPTAGTLKRKAKADDFVSSDAEDSDFGELEGVLSQSETDSDDDSEEEDSEDELDDGELEALDSDEVPSEDEKKEEIAPKKYMSNVVPRQTANRRVLGLPNRFEEDDTPNYRVVKDANGNERYEYEEIEPGYDSDDSDAPIKDNTIGDIPLSFYDSYPHIGYNINGKRIMRPAKGEALDALLDSIDVPKGWTGLTDPATGKPLNLSQEELEVLKRIQMNELPEDGYDPYPVSTGAIISKAQKLTPCRILSSISQALLKLCLSALHQSQSADSCHLSTRLSAL